MNKEEFAQLLNGRQYGTEISYEEIQLAQENSLVVVFGYSDDCMEFRGAINDEVGCYDGGSAYITKNGLLENKCDCEDCPYFRSEKKNAKKLTAVWDVKGYSWIYQTHIPNAQFEIFEGDEPYCLGIVFSLNNLETMDYIQNP